MIDLHLHSTFSDGSNTPAELVKLAKDAGLSTLSITDHDNVGGLAEGQDAALKLDIKFIPGIEMSSKFMDRNIHLLGYGIDYSNAELTGKIDELRRARVERTHQIIERLNKKNLVIRYEDVNEGGTDNYSIGRVHIGKALYKKNYVRSVGEAFKKYLVPGTDTYVEKKVLPARDAIDIIKKAGGLVFIAHPGIEKLNNHMDDLIKMGIDGVEVYHPNHRFDDILFFEDYTSKRQLLCSGGSDYHGSNSSLKKVVGGIFVPDKCAEHIIERTSENGIAG